MERDLKPSVTIYNASQHSWIMEEKGNRKYGLRNKVKLSLNFVQSLNLHFQLAQKLKNSKKKKKKLFRTNHDQVTVI